MEIVVTNNLSYFPSFFLSVSSIPILSQMLGYYSIGVLGSDRVESKLMMYNVERKLIR